MDKLVFRKIGVDLKQVCEAYFSYFGLFPQAVNNAKKEAWINSTIMNLKAKNFAQHSNYKMRDDSWITFEMNHDCCSGDGFNCVISIDSNNLLMIDKEKNFCGIEGMNSALSAIGSDSLKEFYSHLPRIGLNLKEIKTN